MLVHSPSCILQVLVVFIVAIASLGAGSAGSIPIDGRRLLHETMELKSGVQFKLLHWSHPESPHYIPGLTPTETMNLAVQRSRDRLARLSSGMPVGRVATTNSSSNVTFVSPLSNLQGGYAMDISIGTPPQHFTAIADTGSDLVWVQCLPCSSCGTKSGPFFAANESSTYKGISCSDPICKPVEGGCDVNNTCSYQYKYGSGDTFGDLARETVTVTTTTGHTEPAPNFVFGCAERDDGNFLNQDGIVGLGRGPLSFTSQLGGVYGNKFSYCLVSYYDSSEKTSPILFGNSSIPTAATQYTPMVENPNKSFFGSETFYYIGLKGLRVNGADLDIPSDAFAFDSSGYGGVISDCGTTISQLVDAAYTPLLNKMQSLLEYPVIPDSNTTIGLDLCYNITGVESTQFPNVTMVFDGLNLDLPQDNVFVLIPGLNDTICMALQNAGEGPTISIFGNVQQQNFQFLYDRENNQYGLAKVQCDELTSG